MSVFIKKHQELILLSVFIVVNIVLYAFSIENAPLVAGADAGQYLRPARSLVDLGIFALNPPGWTPDMGEGKIFYIGTPLYSIFLAFPYYLFGSEPMFYVMVVTLQCAVLYLTGWIARDFLSFFNNKHAILLHALIIFNPNSLITAHLIQSETLFALFLVLVVLYLFKIINELSRRNIVMLGIVLGLLTFTRPAGLYVIYITPIIIIGAYVIRNLVDNDISDYIAILSKSLIVVLIALTVISPWYIRNYINTGEMFLTTTGGAYLHDNYTQLLQIGSDMEWDVAARKSKQDIALYLKQNNIDVNCVQDRRIPECHSHVFDAVYSKVSQEPATSHMKALIYSWGMLYLSGGASNIRNYLGFDGNSLIVEFQHQKFEGFNSILHLFDKAALPYLLMLLIVTPYAVIMRFVAVVGIFRVLRQKKIISYLIPILGVLVIFTAMYLYLGQSRFRVPLEPLLMLLAVLSLRAK